MPKQIFNVIEEVCNKACQPSHSKNGYQKQLIGYYPDKQLCHVRLLIAKTITALRIFLKMDFFRNGQFRGLALQKRVSSFLSVCFAKFEDDVMDDFSVLLTEISTLFDTNYCTASQNRLTQVEVETELR